MTSTVISQSRISNLIDIQKNLISSENRELDFQMKIELNTITAALNAIRVDSESLGISLLETPDLLVVKTIRRLATSAGETAGLTRDREKSQRAELEYKYLNSLIADAEMDPDIMIGIVSELLSQEAVNNPGVGTVMKHFKEHYEGQYNPSTLIDITKRMI